MPTGVQPVGTAIFRLNDATRKDALGSPLGSLRELTVQVWYPAKAPKQRTTALYIPDPALISAMKKNKYNNVSPEVLESWHTVQTHSIPHAPITSPLRLPLLFFSHGFGMSRSNYTSIIEDLASHGYIVVAIDHPHAGFTMLRDGRVLSFTAATEADNLEVVNGQRIDEMVRDASFTLNALMNRKGEAGRFSSHIDPKRVGMLGHSLGGAVALRACQQDDRFKACADLDGDLWGKMQAEGLGRPFLVLLNEPPESRRPPVAVREQRDKGWADFISKERTAAFVIKVGSTNHFSFSDFPFVVPEALMKKHGAEIAPRRGFEIITRLLRAFLSRHLNGEKGEPLEIVAKAYPEVTFKAFDR
jgi:pimeloyl-ACP methyl ester carboxylesterase